MIRADDREFMDFVFDLWSYDDVRDNAEAILARLEDRTMPCDGPWPEERIETFRAWIAAGTPQ